jgi:methylmalonyl-CoA mutase C-terminal domain/subunit
LTKPTQDCHDRGVRYLCGVLRDTGFEVIFTNFLLPDEIAVVAIQEDVDVVGVSSSSGGHLPVFERLLSQLAERGARDILLIAGGIIPPADARRLREWGVGAVFGPGSSAQEVVDFIRSRVELPEETEAR